jgi:hypothetical protein
MRRRGVARRSSTIRTSLSRFVIAIAFPAVALGNALRLLFSDALRSTDDTRTLAATFFNRDLAPRTYALGAALAAAGFISSALVFAALRIGRRGSPTQPRSARTDT